MYIARAFAAVLLVLVIGLVAYNYKAIVGNRLSGSDPELETADLREQRFTRVVERLRIDKNDQSALEDIRRLTNLEPAFLPAHRLSVNRLISEKRISPGSPALRKLRSHLEILSDANDSTAQAMLAHLCVISKEPRQAIQLLRRIVRERPDLSTLLSRLLILQGDKKEARLVTERAIEHFEAKAKTHPDDSAVILSLAANLAILERYSEAVGALRNKAQQVPALREPLIRYAMKEIDITMADDPFASLELLRHVITDDPTNVAIWSRIVRLSDDHESEVADQAMSLLQQWAGKRSTNGKLELVRGAKSFADGDVNTAVDYLEQAYAIAPNSADILNNFASYLSQTTPPQLERAISVADDLIAQYSDQIQFRETRGQILALLDRHDEAIVDLEKAFTIMPTFQPLIDTLASLYETTGNPAKAVALQETAKRSRLLKSPSQNQTDVRALTQEILNWNSFDESTETESAKAEPEPAS